MVPDSLERAVLVPLDDGIGAVRHLFRVASGIDSMIIGEDEILRQVKEAYTESSESGSTDFELNTIFQAAITTAKQIKTKTALSKTPVSAATIAANQAAKLVLMIGASGKIGSSVLKNLLDHANVDVIQTNRSLNMMTSRYRNVVIVPYDSRYEYMNDADCIISATSSPHFTVTAAKLKRVLHTRKPRLLIDLAVPSDIERSASDIEGVSLIGIDDLAELSRHGNELRLTAVQQAETIIEEKLDELYKKMLFRSFLPKLDAARKAAEFQSEPLLESLKEQIIFHWVNAGGSKFLISWSDCCLCS